MNAFRRTRLFVIVGLLAVVALSLSAATAEAGGYGHKTFYNLGFCHYTPTYYTSSYVTYPTYCNYGAFNYGSYGYGCHIPAVNYFTHREIISLAMKAV